MRYVYGLIAGQEVFEVAFMTEEEAAAANERAEKATAGNLTWERLCTFPYRPWRKEDR